MRKRPLEFGVVALATGGVVVFQQTSRLLLIDAVARLHISLINHHIYKIAPLSPRSLSAHSDTIATAFWSSFATPCHYAPRSPTWFIMFFNTPTLHPRLPPASPSNIPSTFRSLNFPGVSLFSGPLSSSDLLPNSSISESTSLAPTSIVSYSVLTLPRDSPGTELSDTRPATNISSLSSLEIAAAS